MRRLIREGERWLNPLGHVILGFYLFVGAVGIYGFWIEPYWIEITRHRIAAPIKKTIRILQLSDLHSRGFDRRERIVLDWIEREKPDAIVITGDFTTAGTNWYRMREGLARFKAPLGTWVIRGNWEVANPVQNSAEPRVSDEWGFYSEVGLRLLVNQSAELIPGLWLIGYDDDLKGQPDVEGPLEKIPAGAFRLALFHTPSLFDRLTGRVDLGLVGHTHGGQVRIPGMQPIYLSPGAEGYVAGWYDHQGTRMYVSRGVGTTFLDFRLFCRPEIAIFEFVPR